MKARPTDVEIVAAVHKWGSRSTTSMVRSVLVHQFSDVDIGTPWILRQLKRLEREGKVQTVDSRVYKTQYVWSATMNQMHVDRGFSRNTVVVCDVDVSSGVAGQTKCIECNGSGDWTFCHPEPHLGPFPCVECKGTGRIWVSI